MQVIPQISRSLNLRNHLKDKSAFLLGPRQTGKTFLIRAQLKNCKSYNLLLREDFRKLSHNPALIREEYQARDKIIVIDEIQKLPELLDEVQYMIEEFGVKFLLTGSSARKLKKYGTNLLGGRARLLNLHPFTRQELGKYFNLEKALNVGLIPGLYFSGHPELDLDSYLATYIQQEISAEGLTRNLPAFSRFLEIAALCNAEQIDYTSVSNDAQVPRTTIHEYFQVLRDTLIGDELPAWRETKKRKPVATPKFYFFDWGVARKLQGLGTVTPKTPLFGKAFESYLYHELKTYRDLRGNCELNYWRSQQQDEVDFIFNQEFAFEVKGKATLATQDLKSLIKLKEEKLLKGYYVIYNGKEVRHLLPDRSITALPYGIFLDQLYHGEFE